MTLTRVCDFGSCGLEACMTIFVARQTTANDGSLQKTLVPYHYCIHHLTLRYNSLTQKPCSMYLGIHDVPPVGK